MERSCPHGIPDHPTPKFLEALDALSAVPETHSKQVLRGMHGLLLKLKLPIYGAGRAGSHPLIPTAPRRGDKRP